MNEENLPQSVPGPSGWRTWASPILAVLLAVLFFSVFGFDALQYGLPGIGITAFVWTFFGAVLLLLGKKARWNFASIFLTAVALLLSLSCGLWRGASFTLLNCFILLFVSAAATFSLSGQAQTAWYNIAMLPETIMLSFLALFSRVSAPFQTLGGALKQKKRAWADALLGVLIAIPVLALVIALLSSADQVFGGIFSNLERWLRSLNFGTFVWRVARTLVLALFLCSGFYYLHNPVNHHRAEKTPRPANNLPLLIPTFLLNGVYVLFCVIQAAYLFGGREAAAMAGGWAEYARSGFFQLVAVAVVNLGFCAGFSSKRRFSEKSGMMLRILCAVMLVCTAVILISALWRMRLYILAYGLSTLRLMTLWGMLTIAVCILAAGWKLIKPSFQVWGVLLGFGLSSWCVLCLAGPDRIVADYNVNAYLDGRLEEIDAEYLSWLSPDVLPSLRRLQEGAGFDALDLAILRLEYEDSQQKPWTCWRFSIGS